MDRPALGEWKDASEVGGLPSEEFESLPPRKRAGELAMLQLRLSHGLNFDDFAARTGCDARQLFADPIGRFTRTGLLDMNAEGLWFSERGLPVADAVAAEFLDVVA